FHRITRVVAVHGKGGDEDGAVDADLVHRRHHLVTGNVIGPVRHIVPGSFRSVRLVSVDLGIDDRHRVSSSLANHHLTPPAPWPHPLHTLPMASTAASVRDRGR